MRGVGVKEGADIVVEVDTKVEVEVEEAIAKAEVVEAEEAITKAEEAEAFIKADVVGAEVIKAKEVEAVFSKEEAGGVAEDVSKAEVAAEVAAVAAVVGEDEAEDKMAVLFLWEAMRLSMARKRISRYLSFAKTLVPVGIANMAMGADLVMVRNVFQSQLMVHRLRA